MKQWKIILISFTSLVIAAFSAALYPRLTINRTTDADPQSASVDWGGATVAVPAKEPALTREHLTREALLAADWPLAIREIWVPEKVWGWGRLGEYELQRDNPDKISIRKVGSLDTTHFSTNTFLPNGKAPVGSPQQPVFPTDVVANNATRKLYAFFSFGTVGLGGAWGVYESNFFGTDSRALLVNDGYEVPRSYRFSPDGTTLSFIVEKTKFVRNETSNTWEQDGDTRSDFYVIDLLDPTRIITFQIPGSLDQYRREHRFEENGLEYGLATNWVAVWQVTPDGSVEFTRYFGRGTELAGYTQASDKELWGYDRETGKLTLIETIPFEQHSALPVIGG